MKRGVRERVPTFLLDVAHVLVGAAWHDFVLRVQLRTAWEWALAGASWET